MIYTVTCNPSIDLFVEAELVIGELNRVRSEEYMAGGKGINVSLVCKELGAETIASGFLGGFTGAFIREELDKAGIAHHFIECDGITRCNMKVAGTEETEINLNGVTVDRVHFAELCAYLEEHLTDRDALIISGNTAPGVDQTDYLELCRVANRCHALLVVDTNQAYLESILSEHPFLIKPNVAELGGMFHQVISSEDEIVSCARLLQKKGAHYVLVSNGSKGAVLVTPDDVYYGEPLQGHRVNSVGAGDSMVAGFVCEWLKDHDETKALKMGLTCGALSAFSQRLAKREDIERRVKEAVVTHRSDR